MFPQRHSFNHISGASLEQMLHHHHQLPSPHMPTPTEQQQQQRSRWKPRVEVAPNCPRCASTNTKFCYYNNYSLSQPRYFCKGCRRYWTKGGSLRTVPVGGGCRKNRRAKSSSSSRQSQRCYVSEDRESSPGDDVDVDVDVHQTKKGTRDIDMALVFAKFLNPKPSTGSTEEFEIESEAANNASSSSYNYLTPEISVETEPQELSWSGIDELERLLVEDGLWSDATLSSSVTWQPPPVKQMQMQLQLHDLDDLEYSMPLNNADQLLPITSASTMSYDTCWSSFDLSTMQVFSSTP